MMQQDHATGTDMLRDQSQTLPRSQGVKVEDRNLWSYKQNDGADVDFDSFYRPTPYPRFTTQPSYGRHVIKKRKGIPTFLGPGSVHLSPSPRSFPGHKSTLVLFDSLDPSTITHRTSDPSSPRIRSSNESSPLHRVRSMPSALTSSIIYEGPPQPTATSPKPGLASSHRVKRQSEPRGCVILSMSEIVSQADECARASCESPIRRDSSSPSSSLASR